MRIVPPSLYRLYICLRIGVEMIFSPVAENSHSNDDPARALGNLRGAVFGKPHQPGCSCDRSLSVLMPVLINI